MELCGYEKGLMVVGEHKTLTSRDMSNIQYESQWERERTGIKDKSKDYSLVGQGLANKG